MFVKKFWDLLPTHMILKMVNLVAIIIWFVAFFDAARGVRMTIDVCVIVQSLTFNRNLHKHTLRLYVKTDII